MWKFTLSAVVVFSFLTSQVHCINTVLVEPGASVSLECQRRTDTTLVWDKVGSTTGAIAIAGSVQVILFKNSCRLEDVTCSYIHCHAWSKYSYLKHIPCGLKQFELTTISISWNRANKEIFTS